MTKTGMLVGTVDYIAPEQAINAKQADYRSDLYSLGCTLHYLLTGRSAYSGETLMARLVAHREEPIPSLMNPRSDVSPKLDAIFQKMIAKHPNDRYQSMTELVRDLQALQRGEEPTAVAQPPIQNPIPLEPVEEPIEEDTLANFTAPTLEMSLPSTLPRSIIPARRQEGLAIPKPVLLWSSIGAGALAGIVLLFIAASAMLPDLPASVGFSNEPRAVVVIARHKFKSADYRAVTTALTDQDIPFVVVSTTAGEAKGDDGKKVRVDLSLADYQPRPSDVVILCGGHELHEVKTSNIADRSLQKGAVVFAVSNGFDVIYPQYHKASKEAGKDWDEKLAGGEAIGAGNGIITKSCTLNDVPAVVDRAFTELVAK
ncbi:MAG: hypothetical protein CMJ64_16710 [Planctomycetaceae bacterium]|nr:hypothetical protein [Planctomycetaceae bacterium]